MFDIGLKPFSWRQASVLPTSKHQKYFRKRDWMGEGGQTLAEGADAAHMNLG
jgi:hypothetical protein